jgi:phosphoglycerol transferase
VGPTVPAEAAGRAPARRAAWWAYASAAILSLGLVVVIMGLWAADPRVPLSYHAEALFNGVLVKGTLEQGWHLSQPALGAPGRLDLRDLPMSDNNLHFALIRLLGLVIPDYALVMNVFFLLTFPLTAVSALYVFRRFGLAPGPALCGSVLYAVLPFHFSRGQHHLFLAAYYPVPLAVMVALWIAAGTVSLVDARERRWSWRRCRPQLIASSLVCVLVASSGTYYAYFACFFFLVAGALAAIRQRDARALALPLALAGVTLAVLTAHFAPSLLHLWQEGGTPVVRRNPMDAETYGLRISQLLMPVTGHRLEALAEFKDVVNARLPSNENDDASLGIVGALGFLALLGRLVLPEPRTTRDGPGPPGVLHALSVLNLSAVLLATLGGFGVLVALTISSKIRAYNRISVYIAFFSLFAVVIALDHVSRRYCREPSRRGLFAIGLAGLLVLGVLDQTSIRAVPSYASIAAEYRSDARFVHALEAATPPGAMIFQLPAVPFPEHPPIHRMQDYDHARGYLHSRHLRWSYGAMKGRDGEAWQEWVAAKPPRALVETLAAAGFSGLYVNRDGYPDRGAGLIAEIARALGRTPWSSDNGRLLFFDLTSYGRALRAQHTAAEWEAKAEAARHPLLVVWQRGCWELEGTREKNFRWCTARGEWRLVNGARRARRITLEMSLAAPAEANLWIRGPLLSEHFRIGPGGLRVSRTISVPPGRHTISFGCDGRKLLSRADRRDLVFRVHDFRAMAAEP